jgi:hypothetical protein
MTEIPKTRNSDIELTIEIWKRFYPNYIKDAGGVEVVPLRALYELPREDNVKRLRAFIQNTEGRLPPTTWEVAKQRGINKEIWESSIVLKKVDLRT